MNHDSLTIRVRREPGYVIITAAGEIDIFTVARLREQLFTLAGDGQPVIADLDRVTSSARPGPAARPPQPVFVPFGGDDDDDD